MNSSYQNKLLPTWESFFRRGGYPHNYVKNIITSTYSFLVFKWSTNEGNFYKRTLQFFKLPAGRYLIA
jgi:hypothetical protein